MSFQALRNINRGGAATESDKPKNFPAMLEQFKGEIARALPKHINPDRMARIALTAFRMTPKLGECDPRSVFAAVIQLARFVVFAAVTQFDKFDTCAAVTAEKALLPLRYWPMGPPAICAVRLPGTLPSWA